MRPELMTGMAETSAGPLCKQSAPRSTQLTTPAPHHLIFYRPDALPNSQPAVLKH